VKATFFSIVFFFFITTIKCYAKNDRCQWIKDLVY